MYGVGPLISLYAGAPTSPAVHVTVYLTNFPVYQEHDFGVGSLGEDERYTIKVCGSLSVTHGNPCSGQTGVCRYRAQPASSGSGGTVLTDAVNLGIMYR